MTNPPKVRTQLRVAAIGASERRMSDWLIPPILVPVLLTIMIGLRALSLANPW